MSNERLPASGLCIPPMDSFESDRAQRGEPSTEQLAAETAADPMVNTALIAGGLANALARYGEPDDVLHSSPTTSQPR